MNTDYIKIFCRINPAVTVYDDLINQLKDLALHELSSSGALSNETNLTVKDYVQTYVRLRIVSEPSDSWRKAEEARLQSIYEALFFRGKP